MKFIFWNVARKNLETEIIKLVSHEKPDFLILAEYEGDELLLLKTLMTVMPALNYVPSIAALRIAIFSTLTPPNFRPLRDESRSTFQEVNIPSFGSLTLGVVHLISKLWADSDDQLNGAMILKSIVEDIEESVGHKNTILLGDFNMNPYDKGMINSAGIHAISCNETAQKNFRTVQGEKKSFFYNPCWNLMGDFNSPPGSFYHSPSGVTSNYWNQLDQVIFRPCVSGLLIKSSLRYIDRLQNISFVCQAGKPNLSDHLPLTFNLQF